MPKEPAAGAPPNILPNQTVTWEGSVESPHAGSHKFQLYGSSYFKVYVDDKLVLDRWRQNWNAWYHNFDRRRCRRASRSRSASSGFRRMATSRCCTTIRCRTPSATRSRSPRSRAAPSTITSSPGNSQDEVIAGYRQLTGKAVLLPRWAYGFWQSRQRYTNQQELLGVVAEYRKRKIPLDNIVLDWFYWKEDSWGSHEFDTARFPDPKGMIDKVHAQNAHLMISVWPKFYPAHGQLQGAGRGRVHVPRQHRGRAPRTGWAPGYTSSFYDPYSKPARDMYWRQVNEKLGVLGVDAWWMDATEPDPHSNLDIDSIKARIGPDGAGPGGGVLQHLRAGAQRWRLRGLARRAARQARVHPHALGLRRHPAQRRRGVERRHRLALGRSVQPDLRGREHRLLGTAQLDLRHRRLRQRGALQHAETRRPPTSRNGASSTCAGSSSAPSCRCSVRTANSRSARSTISRRKARRCYDSLVWHDQLRYRLLPYIYTVAADTYHRDGTIMRGLAMDFADDPQARDVRDEYLFGKALLVAPVYQFKARTRHGLSTGGRATGTTSTPANATPAARRSKPPRRSAACRCSCAPGRSCPWDRTSSTRAEKPGAPITLLVFTGSDGSFELYEDDGVSYGYEKGEFARIPLRYDAAKGTLTIGARAGSFPGMPEERTFKVRWIKDWCKAAGGSRRRGRRHRRIQGRRSHGQAMT